MALLALPLPIPATNKRSREEGEPSTSSDFDFDKEGPHEIFEPPPTVSDAGHIVLEMDVKRDLQVALNTMKHVVESKCGMIRYGFEMCFGDTEKHIIGRYKDIENFHGYLDRVERVPVFVFSAFRLLLEGFFEMDEYKEDAQNTMKTLDRATRSSGFVVVEEEGGTEYKYDPAKTQEHAVYREVQLPE